MTPTSGDHPEKFRRWARISFYYPGLTPDILATLPNGVTDAYEAEIPRLVAERQSQELDVVSFPHMTNSDRRKVLRGIDKHLKRDREVEQPENPEQMAAAAAAAGIGIKFVKPGEGSDAS